MVFVNTRLMEQEQQSLGDQELGTLEMEIEWDELDFEADSD